MNDPFADPAGSREEILGAAYHALCRHGYADLTIQRIGGAFEKSPALIYHHYESKDELLLDLLEFLLDDFEAAVSGDSFDLPPRRRIRTYVLAVCDPEAVEHEGSPDAAFLRAVVELRAQATHDAAYRAHFERSDRVLDRFLARSVREAAAALDPAEAGPADDGASGAEPAGQADDGASGAEPAGVVPEEVAPEAVATVIATLATGGTFRRATTEGTDWVADVTAGVERYLDATLPAVEPA
ncbi:TetR/AcrR family transcriptional regulator [Halorubrum vacuolatum]|uniref:Transcriptional regulator, TetR family n=1 Tax=Halorubrum vacuolatum TaxID=63740 RepID=A0A238W4G3_HALVU|nr:TetR/AcrR family transcriptional regulator [Halorubrum vacuolatum]SNR41495.1 transcriptional regulator, TetR family [Halorubrum vacuolatum]